MLGQRSVPPATRRTSSPSAAPSPARTRRRLGERAGVDEVELRQPQHVYVAPFRSVVSAASFFFRSASSRVIIVPAEERMPERSFSR